ncbi:hypothetical protein HA402_012516 [Bradysia odoriphaga]|nr:hypothetical protein HA402_012516 [Bradysia odoriphaga]
MDSGGNDVSGRYTPNQMIETARVAVRDLVPQSSRERYEKMYNSFKAWQAVNKSANISQTVLLAFFHEMAQKHKPSTLWAYYSMLKTTIRANDNLDIGQYVQLSVFLKSKASGYLPVKAGVFSLADIHKFIDDAPDELWLDVKVVCIFAVSGACSSHELPRIHLNDVENHGDMLLVRILKSKTKVDRSFTITGAFRTVVQRYLALRRPGMEEQRFFINYQRGKCTNQVIGKNKFASMPRRIARYLNLPEPDSFTGHSFRKTSHSFQKTSSTILTNGFIEGTESTRSQSAQHNLMGNSITPIGYPDRAQTSNTNVILNGSNTVPLATTSYSKGPRRKLGEIYCNDMGELTYQCTVCSAEMDHSDEFSLHYMSHFRDVFQDKEESQQRPNISQVEYIISEPISIIKLEEPETIIKSEPLYFEEDG